MVLKDLLIILEDIKRYAGDQVEVIVDSTDESLWYNINKVEFEEEFYKGKVVITI